MKKIASLIIILLYTNSIICAQNETKEYKGAYFSALFYETTFLNYSSDRSQSIFTNVISSYKSVGLEVGRYNGAQSTGLLIAYGNNTDDDEVFFKGEKRYENYLLIGGIGRTGIIVTKTKSATRFHLGASFLGAVYQMNGKEATEYIYDLDNRNLLKDIVRRGLVLDVGLFIELGRRIKNVGSIHANFQPISLFLWSQGIGFNFFRVALIAQL